MFIPGTLVALLTFPGVMCHEYAHAIACRRRKIPIYEVCYFQLGTPSGYVRHREAERHRDAFWITTAPFFINSLLAIVIVFAWFGISGIVGAGTDSILSIITVWLAFSIGMHALPSKGDAMNLWRLTKREWKTSVLAIFSIPVVVFLYISHYLQYLWFDVLFAILLIALGVTAVNFMSTGLALLPL